MISISKMSGAGKGNYYVGLGAEDYYLKGGEPLGEWFGIGAVALKLPKIVEPVPFRNLLRGFSVDGSTKLVQNAGAKKCQSGWDLTFCAPKSVSVFWAMSPPETRKKIQEAHKEAVKASLRFLEQKYLFARTGNQGRSRERAQLVAALFEHATSRAQDPLIHTHALVLSRSPRADGKTGTIISRLLYEHKRELDRVYCRHFAKFFETDLKLRVNRSKGNFELADVSWAVCTYFSKRRGQILERTAELGHYNPQAARIAALDTRVKKESLPRPILFARWEESGRNVGFGPEQALGLLQRHKKLSAPDAAASSVEASSDRPASGIVGGLSFDSGAFKGFHTKANGTQAPSAKRLNKLQGKSKTVPISARPTPKPPLKISSKLSPIRADEQLATGPAELKPARNAPATPKAVGKKPTPVSRNGAIEITQQNYDRTYGRTVFSLPFTNFEVRATLRPMFPKAPFWSPFRKLSRVIVIRKGAPLPPRLARYKKRTLFDLGPVVINLNSNLFAPHAPRISPLYGVRLKSLSISVRPALQELKRIREQYAKRRLPSIQRRDLSKALSR